MARDGDMLLMLEPSHLPFLHLQLNKLAETNLNQSPSCSCLPFKAICDRQFQMDAQYESKELNKCYNIKCEAANKQTSKSNMF